MRTLNKIKISLWVVRKLVGTETTDVDGNFTGDYEITFSTPIEVELPLYPSTSEITSRIFGKDASFDMVSLSCDVVLHKDDYLFYNEPIEDFDSTYDFTVSSIAHSFNIYNYGLKARVK